MVVYSEAERQQFFDSRSKRASSANVLIENTAGELLVVKANYKSYWSLPGGWIDDGETPLVAAIREAKEEVGIDVTEDELELEGIINRVSKYTQTYLFVFRFSRPVDTDPAKLHLQASEIDEARYVSKADVQAEPDLYNTTVHNWAAAQPRRYLEIAIS